MKYTKKNKGMNGYASLVQFLDKHKFLIPFLSYEENEDQYDLLLGFLEKATFFFVSPGMF